MTLPESIEDLEKGKAAQFSVEVAAPQGGTVSVTFPPGFQSQPLSYDVPSSPDKQTFIFIVTPPARNQVINNGTIQARLVRQGQSLAAATRSIDYRIGQSLIGFYLFGVLGVVIGYAMRKLMKAFSDTPPPVDSLREMAAEEPVPNWFRQLVADHYYFVDLLITLVFGILALYKLVTSDQRPPEDGLFPMGAIVLGFFIGLLTHSELVTKVSAKSAAVLSRAFREKAGETRTRDGAPVPPTPRS